MFMVLFTVFFVLPSALFLVGAVVLQSFHLLFGGLVMAAASAMFFIVSKRVERKKKAQDEARPRDPRQRTTPGAR